MTLSAELAGKVVTWQGNIIRSEGVIDAENRMVYLVAEIKDPYLRNNKVDGQLPLKYGSFVTAVIKGRTVDGIVKLPRHIVRNGNVAVVGADSTVEIRPVNVVRTDIEFVYIKDNLKDGERISVTNINTITNGQLVKVIGETSGQSQDDTSTGTLVAAGEQ